MADPVMEISDLVTYFYVPGGVVKAVDGVNLEIREEEILTVVGESGSGKSVTALSIMRLIQEPGKIIRGQIRFGGVDLLTLSEREMDSIRGDRISMIFQNPYTSLHPHFKIADQTTEALRLRRHIGAAEARDVVVDMFERLGIEAPRAVLASYPFEVSAGVCQRVMLAMALTSNPKLLIADEPTTNLDAMTQIQILELIRKMRDELHMSVLLITHDFGVVSKMADRVVVMYAGRQVESGPAGAVLGDPQHPYAEGLINSVPAPGHTTGKLFQIPGEVPDVMRLPPGCSFRPRCGHAEEVCHREPPMIHTAEEHTVRCWRFAEGRTP